MSCHAGCAGKIASTYFDAEIVADDGGDFVVPQEASQSLALFETRYRHRRCCYVFRKFVPLFIAVNRCMMSSKALIDEEHISREELYVLFPNHV